MNRSSIWKLVQLIITAKIAVACVPMSVSPGATEHLVPLTAVTEGEDEWLHAHCVAKKVLSAESRAEGDHLLRGAGANFGELVYDDGKLNAVGFACPTRPDWSSADEWVQLTSMR